MTQNNEILQQLSDLPNKAKRALLTRLMQTQSEQTEHWEPLSYNQQAVWFHMNLAPESVAYNLLYSVRIFDAIDSPALHLACQKLVQRYPILTATFVLHNENLAQHIKPHQTLPIKEIDATTWSSDALRHEITSNSNQIIDLAQGPLFRILLFRRSSVETILAFITHHIVIDFWAFNILIDELFTLYSAAKTNSIITLPPLTWQHNDYVQWQQTMLTSATGQQHWHYWQETLSSPLPLLRLPTDYSRPPVQSYHGATFELTLNRKLTQQLRMLASREKVTLFTLVLAGYQTLIFRYTHQSDILIGTPTLGRNEVAFERLIDDLANPVIIRSHLTSELSFLQLLRQTQQHVFHALEHQDYPFSLLVERLQPERDLSYPPLYQTAFTWDKPRRSTTSMLTVEPFIYGQQGTLFELALTIFELDNELIASFRYSTPLFELSTIERLAHHFMMLLEGLVRQPDQSIQRIPLLTHQEQQHIVLDQNHTQTPLSHARSIPQLIAEQAQRTPDALALVFGSTALTYYELNERANQVAHHLRREGIGPEISVGVCMERSSELVILLLGILKAGGSYIPLDPHYPTERIAWMLNDAQPALVLTQKPLSAHLSTQVRICYLEDMWPEFAIEETGSPIEITEAQQTAYIIYTSGSTGRPKGVVISHRNVLNFFVGMNATLPEENTQSHKIWLAVTSISFDISVLELFWTLSRGFQVVLQKEQSTYHPIQSQYEEFSVAQQLIRSEASYLQCTPSLMNMLLLLPETPIALHNIHHLLLGGEALPLALVKKLQKLTSATIHNMYGPTETTIWSSTSQLLPDSSRIVLGHPLANTQIYILDNELQPVPTGVIGELYISGHGVARGYLNRPDLTAERFLPNLWSEGNSARMYRTGDLARYHSNGEIEYLGRIDQQIKLRGFRIELGEIEAVLQSHPMLQEAAVTVYMSDETDPYLVAYIVVREGVQVETATLQTYLHTQMPDYMVPTLFISLSELPKTPNGKTDRQMLPLPKNAQTLSVATFVAPTTQLHIQLAELWEQTLHLTQVGITDNFFELGGHSLLLTKLAMGIRSTFEVNIPLRDLFEAPTIERMALRIEQIQNEIITQADNKKLMQILATLEAIPDDKT